MDTHGAPHVDPGTRPDEQPPPPLTPAEMRTRTKEIRIANRYRQAQLESKLLESFSPWGFDGFGGTDQYERFFLNRGGRSDGGWVVPPSLPSDRKLGASWPFWRTDHELNRYRQASRILVKTNSYAKGLLGNLTNYVIGKGFTYKAAPKEDAAKEIEGVAEIAKGVQKVIDFFCDKNNWNTAAESNEPDEDGAVPAGASTKEREAYWRVPRDGEAMIRLFFHDDGTVDCRFIGPELVWGMPPGKTQADGWSFGMQHRVNEDGTVDESMIVAYYVRHREPIAADDDGDNQGDIVPAHEIIHIKDPFEDAEVKHGTPAFSFDTLDACLRAAKLQRNISVSAAVRAATAEVWKHSIGTQAQIQSLANTLPGARTNQPSGLADDSTITEQFVRAGAIRRVPTGQEPVPFSTTTNVPEHQQAAQGDLRQFVSAFSAPEYMAGSTNDANFATASEAGAPFVNAAIAEQEHFKMSFLRLMWRVVRWAVKCGKLPQEALKYVQITVEGQAVQKNNEGEQASARNINLQCKVTSPQIEAAKLGNDPQKIMADWKEWGKEMGPEQPQPQPAAGGAPPPKVPPVAAPAAGDDEGNPPPKKIVQPAAVRESLDADDWIDLPAGLNLLAP